MDPPSFQGPEEKQSLRSAVMGSSRNFGSLIKEGKDGFQKAASSLCHESFLFILKCHVFYLVVSSPWAGQGKLLNHLKVATLIHSDLGMPPQDPTWILTKQLGEKSDHFRSQLRFHPIVVGVTVAVGHILSAIKKQRVTDAARASSRLPSREGCCPQRSPHLN